MRPTRARTAPALPRRTPVPESPAGDLRRPPPAPDRLPRAADRRRHGPPFLHLAPHRGHRFRGGGGGWGHAARRGQALARGVRQGVLLGDDTVIGSGDASFVTSPGGYIIGWVLAFFGVAIVAAMTGAVVASSSISCSGGSGHGHRGVPEHIVVCGWNATARDLFEELRGTNSPRRSSSSTTASATPPVTASTSCAATSRAPTTSSGPGSARPHRRSSSPRTARTRRTCAPSWR